MAAFLGVDLSTVSRLENGQVPHGSSARLLCLLSSSVAQIDVNAFLDPASFYLNSPVLSSAGDGGVPLVLTDGTPQPISRSPEPLQAGDAGVQLQSPRGCTPDIKTSEVINDRL